MSLVPKGSTKEGIIEQWGESSRALKTDKVAFYLLHTPDDKTPISETMEGIQAIYEAGHFDEVPSASRFLDLVLTEASLEYQTSPPPK